MSVVFFGQFLIERGEIDEAELREALNLMEYENRTLGEIAVDVNYTSAADARRVNGEQRRLDHHLRRGYAVGRRFEELRIRQPELGCVVRERDYPVAVRTGRFRVRLPRIPVLRIIVLVTGCQGQEERDEKRRTAFGNRVEAAALRGGS